MCGIVAVLGISNNAPPAAPILLEALRRLEYRGYDSAGVATLVDGHIERRRAAGKLEALASILKGMPLGGATGIGHTRWATHGAPTETNAHPHGTPRVSVVHNGIIENHTTLRAELEAKGQEFSTETDTETVAQLLDYYVRQGANPDDAIRATLPRLHGAYALAAIFAGHPQVVFGAEKGAPLAVGFGENALYLGSDALALAPLTRRIAYLKDGDWVRLDRDGAHFFCAEGTPVKREIVTSRLPAAALGKGNYRHFMEKELYEHPAVLGNVLRRLVDPTRREVALPNLPFELADVPFATITACGSAYYAGLLGRLWIESLARLPADADVASEFRYRSPPLAKGGLGILVSQSGETADSLAALHYMRAASQHVVSIINAPESTMARESEAVLETFAGPEIGVASTKAFSAQLAVLACFSLALGRARQQLSPEREQALTAALLGVPERAAAVLAQGTAIRLLAERIAEARDVLYLGRGTCFPIALEGALKLKEISYIHAEAYAAGEMKHGPIALIDSHVPVVAIAPSGPLFEKTVSNLAEAAARGGKVFAFTDPLGAVALKDVSSAMLVLPQCEPFAAPILYAIAVQLLAYHVAVLKGTDVDQPRNLAKSVTVE